MRIYQTGKLYEFLLLVVGGAATNKKKTFVRIYRGNSPITSLSKFRYKKKNIPN